MKITIIILEIEPIINKQTHSNGKCQQIATDNRGKLLENGLQFTHFFDYFYTSCL